MRPKGHGKTNEILQAFIEKRPLRTSKLDLKVIETIVFLQAFVKKGL